MATRSRASAPARPQRAGCLSLELPCRKPGLKAEGLYPHHHSNSPMALSPQTSLPVQFPGQGHRGFQTHTLKSRGPESGSQRRGVGSLATRIVTCAQSAHRLSLPSWPVSCSLSWRSGPSQAEAHRLASAWEPCAPLTRQWEDPRTEQGAGRWSQLRSWLGVHSCPEQNGTWRWLTSFWPDSELVCL